LSELDVELLGPRPANGPDEAQTRELVAAALASARVTAGHVAVQYVDGDRIAQLNREHRAKNGPTDVLSFPIDGAGDAPGPRELGDVVICAAHTTDLREAIVHGALHLVGMDHETDDGEMLAVQAEILAR
jgi:probable rRNA maturation factor